MKSLCDLYKMYKTLQVRSTTIVRFATSVFARGPLTGLWTIYHIKVGQRRLDIRGMSDFLTSAIIVHRVYLTDPYYIIYLGQSESLEKSTPWRTNVHSVTTSGLLPPSCELLESTGRASLRLSESTQKRVATEPTHHQWNTTSFITCRWATAMAYACNLFFP